MNCIFVCILLQCFQGPVLSPLLCHCTVYTTPLSSLISLLSLIPQSHHLYATDTQLIFSFRPPNFDSSITHLQHAVQQISFWMTASYLTLPRRNSCLLVSKSNLLMYTAPHQTLALIHPKQWGSNPSSSSFSFTFPLLAHSLSFLPTIKHPPKI